VQAASGTYVKTATVTIAGQALWSAAAAASWSGGGSWQDSITNSTIAAPGLRGITGDTALIASSTGTMARLDGASPALAGITFNNSATSYTVAQGSGGSLTMQGANGASLSVLAGSDTISAPLHLASNTEVNAATATTLTISGAIDGGGSLTKTGGGALVLSGANAYAGGTAVTSGTLLVINAGALPDGSNLSIGTNAGQFFTPATVVPSAIASSVVPSANSIPTEPAATPRSPIVFRPAITDAAVLRQFGSSSRGAVNIPRYASLSGQSGRGNATRIDGQPNETAALLRALDAALLQYGD